MKKISELKKRIHDIDKEIEEDQLMLSSARKYLNSRIKLSKKESVLLIATSFAIGFFSGKKLPLKAKSPFLRFVKGRLLNLIF